jgi:hypothetical protein
LPNGEAEKQLWAMLEKPMSLPPMPTVTTRVSASSAPNCGGLGPE